MKYSIVKIIHKRLCWILYTIEELLQAFSCFDHYYDPWDSVLDDSPKIFVRWWHPAAWLGWIRTVILRDERGCNLYRRFWYVKNNAGDLDEINWKQALKLKLKRENHNIFLLRKIR